MSIASFAPIFSGLDRYIITRNGAVFDAKTGQVKATYLRNGYRIVNIDNKNYYVHRLLAQAFLPNPDNLPCINHIDGNKLNNALSNLEWCTYTENIQHAYDNRLRYNARRIMCLETGEVYSSISLASRSTGIGVSALSACLTGKHKTCHKQHWKYID